MTVEIPRHLADPERGVILRNGASVRVRAIRPDDERRLLALCGRLSPRTLYQRFFSFRRLLPEEARAFANVDYGLRMAVVAEVDDGDRKSTRLNSSHGYISYAVFCLKKKKQTDIHGSHTISAPI